MTATTNHVLAEGGPLQRGDGVELLGSVDGSGYRDGVALVRRADGQMVQLGSLLYALLEGMDGQRNTGQLARAVSHRTGRRVEEAHILRLAQKLAGQGLLSGWEHHAPPRRNPLLALRWKVLVTNPDRTRQATAPFSVLFRPWIVWPMLGAFAVVVWYVLVDKGVASATAQAFNRPDLLLLVFALAVVSAGFHELGHAAACRYGGATPGGMGMGLYMVWPAFYTDVTDAYRLPRRDRLRIDLAGLYFNAVVAVATMAVWLVWRVDALLLVVAFQLLQMVRQLSPVIRADGYHILSDATGVPDLYSHMGPTLRRLLPSRRREPSSLTGWARLLVTLWVIVIVPVLLSLMLGAVLLLPRLATTAWDSGRHIALGMPHQAARGQIVDLLAALLRLVALVLPVAGSALVAQKFIRTLGGTARSWSRDSALKRATVVLAAAGIIAGLAWAWWPSGQYQAIRPNDRGNLSSLPHLLAAPASTSRPATVAPSSIGAVAPGIHLALAAIPAGGLREGQPAFFLIPGVKGRPAAAIVAARNGSSSSTTAADGAAFPFVLPNPPPPGGTQALAIGTRDGGVAYNIAYAVITVGGNAPVSNTNSAYALADCKGCTTVAISFQVVLVVGQTHVVTPVDAAGALNVNCPACVTIAIADQIVVTLHSQPSQQLLQQLQAALAQLNVLPKLGGSSTPASIAAAVAAVQQEIITDVQNSGLLANPTTASASSSPTTIATGTGGSGSMGTSTPSVPSTPTTPSTVADGGVSNEGSTPPATTAPSSDTSTGSTVPTSGGSGASQTPSSSDSVP